MAANLESETIGSRGTRSPIAGLIKEVRNGTFPRAESVMVNPTGGERPRTPAGPSVRWLRRDGARLAEEA